MNYEQIIEIKSLLDDIFGNKSLDEILDSIEGVEEAEEVYRSMWQLRNVLDKYDY